MNGAGQGSWGVGRDYFRVRVESGGGVRAGGEATLGARDDTKQITVCQDETFHPETCLVAIEPVSNYILLEKYAENRTAATWTQAIVWRKI